MDGPLLMKSVSKDPLQECVSAIGWEPGFVINNLSILQKIDEPSK